MKTYTCHDCGAKEGEIHEFGCDMEYCPYCGGQLLSCACAYKFLKLDCRPGTRVYQKGMTPKEVERWISLLDLKGRVPCICYPNHCVRCGALWPEMFMVSDAEWKHYIQINQRDEMLCWTCYQNIVAMIDAHVTRPNWLPRELRWVG